VVYGEKSTVIIDGQAFNPRNARVQTSYRSGLTVRALVEEKEYTASPDRCEVSLTMVLNPEDTDSVIEWFNEENTDKNVHVPPEIRNYSVEQLLSYVNAMIEERGGE
jgi:hypothetical protein